MPVKSGLGAVVVVLAAAVGAFSVAQNAGAFGGHKSITVDAFDDPTHPGQFLRTGVLEVINEQHAFMDRGATLFPPTSNISDDYRHFDDCDFDGATAYINRRYDQIQDELTDHDPYDAALNFGRALHPAQDFYAHSNWVEIGFPLTDDPATPQLVEGGVTQADLIDLSGAQMSLAQRWFAPAGGGKVRGAAPLRSPFGAWDILLGADDWVIPGEWEIEKYGRDVDPGGRVRYVPTLIDQHGATSGKLLITGRGSGDTGCNVSSEGSNPLFADEFVGPKHGDKSFGLNKDSPDNERGRGVLYYPARKMAVLQTSYEFCRAVREAASARPVAQDGLLVAMWIKPDANPHPANTPCAPAQPGPKEVSVTITGVEVRNDHEEGGPGQIQLAATLYDSPLAFRRSVHATNTNRMSMSLNTFDDVRQWQLPKPLRLCVGADESATFALHAWENDGSEARFKHAYDESDDLLVGIQHRLAGDLRTEEIEAEGRDLTVRYRIGQRDSGASPACVVGPVKPGAGG
jgi:hypothetical protein